jgi:hypothetical protein
MAKVQHFYAGWNRIGDAHNPDVVLHGVSAEHAIDYIVGEIAHVGDWVATKKNAHAYTQAWEEAQDWDIPELERDAELHGGVGGHRSVHVDGYDYWVIPCFAEHCDQINSKEK